MTRQFKSFLSGFLLLALAGGAVSGLRRISPSLLKRALSCGAPCQRTAEGEYPGCSPIEPRLQLKASNDPRSSANAIWYRASFKNNTCEEIELDAKFFTGNEDNSAFSNTSGAVRLIVSDGNGKPLRPRAAQDDGAIEPYAYDLGEIIPYQRKSGEPSARYTYIVIPPGAEVAASRSVLAPHRKSMTDRHEDGMDYSVVADVPVDVRNPEKRYAVPPAGFRRLDEYVLPPSGRVTAKLQINQGLYSEHVEGGLARRFVLRVLYLLSGNSRYSKRGGKIAVESEPVSLEISR